MGTYKYGWYRFEAEPFYVGKGKGINGSRHLDHLNEAKTNFTTKNQFKLNKIRKIWKSKLEPIIIKYKEDLLEEQSFKLEVKMIKRIGRSDLKEGPLTNLTDGGEGFSGYKFTEENKKNMSLAQNRPEVKENNRLRSKKLWQDKNYKNKVLKEHSKSVSTKGYREKQRKNTLERYLDPKIRSDHQKLMKEVHNRTDIKKQKSKSMKNYFSNVKNLKKHKIMQKEVQNRPEVKKKNSETTKKTWKDPNFLEKIRLIHNSKEHKEKLYNSFGKYWKITNPLGQTEVVKNLSNFCRKNKLSRYQLSKTKISEYKGWKCEKMEFK